MEQPHDMMFFIESVLSLGLHPQFYYEYYNLTEKGGFSARTQV